MVTTIQVNEKTLLLLKKLKEELKTASYDEAIQKSIIKSTKSGKNMGGSLRKYLKKGETVKDIIRELQKERRLSDRF